MPSVRNKYDLANVDKWEDAKRFVADSVSEIQAILQGQVEFSYNIKSQLVDANFTVANSDLRIVHSLGTTPSGYILASSSAGTRIYTGSVPADSGSITLRATDIASTKILLF